MGNHIQTFHGHSGAVVSVAAPPAGTPNLFLTGSQDRTMRLWDARAGSGDNACVAMWQQQDWVTCVQLHPTNPHLAFSSDKSVRYWDLRNPGGASITAKHRHRKLISRFRADPCRLASCSLDGCVKVSSLEEPGVRHASPALRPQNSPMGVASPAEVGDESTLRTSSDYVLCIDFDESRLFAGSVDGCVDVYGFSQEGHFRAGCPWTSSPTFGPSSRCGEPVDVHMSGMEEITV